MRFIKWNFLKQALFPAQWLLHATRTGAFEIYQITNTRQLAATRVHNDLSSVQEWLQQHADTRLQHARWRVLADLSDPISTCVKLPPLGRRDQQAFIAQRLQTYNPESPWRYADAAKNSESVFLTSMADALDPKQRLEPILSLISELGQHIDAIVTPGQLICTQYGQISQTELLISHSSSGQLLVLSGEGKYRFSRLLPQAVAPTEALAYLYPTLLTHHLLARNQAVGIRELPSDIDAQALLRQLATTPLSALPHTFSHTKGYQQRWLGKHGHLPLLVGLGLAGGVAGLSYGGFNTAAENTHLVARPTSQMAHNLAQENLRSPSPFKALYRLSNILDQHPEFNVQKIRWEHLENAPAPQFLLDIESHGNLSPSLLSLKPLLEKFASMGQATIDRQIDENHIRIALKLFQTDLRESAIDDNQRDLFVPTSPEQLQQWFSDWLKINTQGRPEFPISAKLDDFSSSVTQPTETGTLTFSITANSEISALLLLEALIDHAPAVLNLPQCEWAAEHAPNTIHSLCHFRWQRFPNTTNPFSQNQILPGPLVEKASSENHEIEGLGTLLWSPQERQKNAISKHTKSSKTPANTLNNGSDKPASLPESYGWIKRSDGMVLRWPAQ